MRNEQSGTGATVSNVSNGSYLFDVVQVGRVAGGTGRLGRLAGAVEARTQRVNRAPATAHESQSSPRRGDGGTAKGSPRLVDVLVALEVRGRPGRLAFGVVADARAHGVGGPARAHAQRVRVGRGALGGRGAAQAGPHAVGRGPRLLHGRTALGRVGPRPGGLGGRAGAEARAEGPGGRRHDAVAGHAVDAVGRPRAQRAQPEARHHAERVHRVAVAGRVVPREAHRRRQPVRARPRTCAEEGSQARRSPRASLQGTYLASSTSCSSPLRLDRATRAG